MSHVGHMVFPQIWLGEQECNTNSENCCNFLWY